MTVINVADYYIYTENGTDSALAASDSVGTALAVADVAVRTLHCPYSHSHCSAARTDARDWDSTRSPVVVVVAVAAIELVDWNHNCSSVDIDIASALHLLEGDLVVLGTTLDSVRGPHYAAHYLDAVLHSHSLSVSDLVYFAEMGSFCLALASLAEPFCLLVCCH